MKRASLRTRNQRPTSSSLFSCCVVRQEAHDACFSFAFGAICIALDETEAGFTPSAWHSLRNVRERLGPFLRISLLLFVLLLVAQAASALLGTGVFWILHQLQVRRSRFAILMVSYALVGPALLVFSRFAL